MIYCRFKFFLLEFQNFRTVGLKSDISLTGETGNWNLAGDLTELSKFGRTMDVVVIHSGDPIWTARIYYNVLTRF